jgi:hypothetical protein
MTLTTASNNTNINTLEAERMLPVLRFWNEYGISIYDVSSEMYRVKSTRQISGFDTSRTYPTFDLAALAVVEHFAKVGLIAAA